MLLKRLFLSACVLLAALGLAHAVNITGVDNGDSNRVVAAGYLRMSVTDTITAFAGGGQTSAVLLTSSLNRVSTVASNNDSVKLPLCRTGPATGVGGGQPINTIGQIMYVVNAGASTLGVFPSTGDTINAIAADGVYSGATTGKTSAFVCASAGKWYSILGG